MRGLALLAAAAALLAGCDDSAKPRLTVDAASSLTEVLPKIDPAPRYNFGGSGELASQLRQGAKADIYASADPKYAIQLFRAGVVERPRVLAGNHLVVIVPKTNPAGIRTLADLAAPGVKIVIGERGVPAGDYARRVLRRSRLGRRIERNVVSEEHDVKAVVAKVALGEADAGFAYRTDVQAASGKVAEADTGALGLTLYAVAVVRKSSHKDGAERLVSELLSRRGQHLLLRDGFVTVGTAGRRLP